ncbi:NusG domain II-containing protein [Breznakiellaceae bacterium SP9]
MLPIKRGDGGIILVFSLVTALSAFIVYDSSTVGNTVVITSNNVRWVFPEDAQETVVVPGPLGTTTVELRGGAVRISASPCANQSCIAQGKIHSRGQWLACLPNGVMVSLEARGSTSAAADGSEIDAATW